MDLLREAINVTPPLRNTTGMKCIAAVIVSQASQAINLSDHFGALGAGHYITLLADGAKIYVALASNSSGTIDEQAQGSAATACVPIPDGTQLPMRLIGGQELATGYATQVNCGTGVYIHAKCAISGVATGWLRIYRSSVNNNQGVEQFRPPGF